MFSKRKIVVLAFLLFSGFLSPKAIRAQSLSGTTGLVTIPTARMQEDGTLNFGTSYFDKKDQQYFEGTKNYVAVYVSLTFLPFLELVYRVNKPLYYHVNNYTMDQTPMVRLRLLKEKKSLPAVVIGIHDIASTTGWNTVHFNATYLVLSKKISAFDSHLGYAPRIMKAFYYQLDGPFGGVAYSPLNSLHLYAEYDSRYVNAGFQYLFLNHFSISLAALNFNSYAAGINYKIVL